MFVLRSLGKLILGSTEQQDLLRLSDGRLYQLERGAGRRVCIFESCTATIRKTEDPYGFVLVVGETATGAARSTGIDESMALRRGVAADGSMTIGWTDGKRQSEYVVAEGLTPATVELFLLAAAECMYERKHRRPRDEAGEADLRGLLGECRVEQGGDVVGAVRGELVFASDPADFYVHDVASDTFVPRQQHVVAQIRQHGPYAFDLVVEAAAAGVAAVGGKADGSPVHSQALDPDALQYCDRATASFRWNYCSAQGDYRTYSLRFSDARTLMAWSNAVGKAVYESLNQERFGAVGEQADYLLNPFTQDVVMAASGQGPESGDGDEDGDGDSSEEEGRDESSIRTEGSAVNRQLAVGFKSDRSFVSRGGTIGVFKHTADDRLEHCTDLGSVRTPQGRAFAPSKMMLHEEDRALVLTEGATSRLYRMDLERGQVVEEWDVGCGPEAQALQGLAPDSKYAQMTPSRTLIGFTERSLFRIDPRIGGTKKRVEAGGKQYAASTKTGFTAAATTGAGGLAVGSRKGDLRLYDSIDRRAKTLLPGFGDPIIGVDVTESGRYLVATCRTYLIFLCTEGQDGALGYSRSLVSSQPVPVRLSLKPEHVAYMGAAPSFTPARFSTGGSEERTIITSTGPYVVTWNVRCIKQGRRHDYAIRKYGEAVVADNFRYGNDRAIVVTLPHHVTMMSRTSLSSPGRKKGAGVVDSPF